LCFFFKADATISSDIPNELSWSGRYIKTILMPRNTMRCGSYMMIIRSESFNLTTGLTS